MKYSLIIFILFISNIGVGQITIHGYCTYYESEDSTLVMNRYFSTEKFNEDSKSIYETIYPLGNPDSEYRIDYNIGNSNDYIHESVIGTDTARYYYIHDTINLRSYIITGTDTSMIYKTSYENGLIIKSDCIFGCEYREEIHHNLAGMEDTVSTIWKDGDTSYSVRVYDNQNRQILFKSFLTSPDEISSMQVKTEFSDSLRTKTVYYGSYGLTGWELNNQIEITYFDKSGIPQKKELIFTNQGKKEYFLIEYQIE